MTKQFKIALVILLVAFIALVAGNYYLQSWTDLKMAKVGMGLAESRYPWRDYTAAELNKMYPQIRYADVPTRVAPEQTYANFRQALKDNNLELAIEQLSKSSRERYAENVADLTVAYNKGEFVEIYKKYPEEIEKSNMYESMAQYYFVEKLNDKITNYPIDFSKNANGDWKMDSL